MQRVLSPAEIALFPKDFVRRINIDAVVIFNRAHNPFARNKILVRGPRIYWPDMPMDFTRESLAVQAVLMHELCHVWQYATGRLSAARYLCDPRNWIYTYDISKGRPFESQPIEKQADLLQDWYRLNRGATAICHSSKTNAPACEDLNAFIPFRWDDAVDYLA